MIFRFVFSARAGRFLILALAAAALAGCSPREQSRGKRWKTQVDAYLQGKAAPSESNWTMKVSEDEEEPEIRQPETFAEVIGALPHPQSWPQLQNGMVLRFLAAQGKGDWRAEIQNRLLHLFFIYLNDSDRYSTKRWDKALVRLDKRIEGIQSRLPENSPDRNMLEQVREEMAAADIEVKKRFGQLNGVGEVEAFVEQLKEMEPVDRKEVAARIGGEDKLSRMENASREIFAAFGKLINKYSQPREREKNQKAMQKEMAEVQQRREEYQKEFSKFEKDPVVQRYVSRASDRSESGSFRQINVPDLVTIAGEPKAEELLKRALVLPVTLDIPVGVSTQKLARKLALQNVEQLKAPQWELAQSLDAVPLFEAMQKRFPAPKEGMDSYHRNSAEVYYLFGLITLNRTDEALAWVGKIYPSLGKTPQAQYRWYISRSILNQLEEAGYGGQVWSFLAKLLDRYPDVPLWDGFIALSSKLDKNEAMMAMVEQFTKNPGANEGNRWETQKILIKAYLASDRVEEGVAVLRTALVQAKSNPATLKNLYEAGVQLAELGQILQRSDWITEGLTAAEFGASSQKADEVAYSQVESLVTLYEKLGRNEDAERVIKAQYQRWLAERDNQKEKSEPLGGNVRQASLYRFEDGAKPFLEALLALYVNEGKSEEALKLLTQSPEWGKPDLADYLKDSAGYPDYPTGYWASWALGRLGRTEEALTVARGQIRVKPGSDGAYAILTQMRRKEAIPFLEKIYRIDQFEERPLIWKAKVLCDAGELDEAEKTAQAAIAVDPSDGEQGKGDRMRVYAVMAEIEKKRGNEEKAKYFQNVVQAIRLSEDADDLSLAGLNTRAIAMYKEALGFFSEAYCIQSRLALQLAKSKKEAEALEHYQKAYELMPESFGRVESHCFGCERAFDGKEAQGVAERVFLQMLKKNPGKPQIYYLLGYLRKEQQRYDEALGYFQQAVALDPLYLNAWIHIDSLKSQVRIDPRLLDQVQLKLLTLDPAGRHSYPDLSSVNDLARLWGHMILADRILNLVPEPEAVFELTASSEALREKQNAQGNFYPERKDEKTFAKILLQHPAINSINRALDVTRKTASGPVEEIEMEEAPQ